MPWSRKSRAKPLLPLWAVRLVQSLSACKSVHFTFTSLLTSDNNMQINKRQEKKRSYCWIWTNQLVEENVWKQSVGLRLEVLTEVNMKITGIEDVTLCSVVQASWNVMAHKPDFVFRRNGRVHLNRRGRQFSRLLAAEVCASAVVRLDTQCSKVVWRLLATHSIRQFPLHIPSPASPCAITFQLQSRRVQQTFGRNLLLSSSVSWGEPVFHWRVQ